VESLLTVAEVARLLQLSRSKVYDLKEKIGFYKLGGAVRFRREDIAQFVEGCRVQGNGQRKVRRRFKLKHL